MRKVLLMFGLLYCLAASATDHESWNFNGLFSLEQMGCDMSTPKAFSFSFFFLDAEGAEKAQESLKMKGYGLRIEPHWEGGGWYGAIELSMIPEYDALTKVTQLFTDEAGANGGEYEAWGARCE